MNNDNMLSGVKRRERILEYIRENEQASVKYMAEKFGVSEMTVRRDFHVLEEQGTVNVFYGGARLRCPDRIYQPFFTRKSKLYECKRAIAKTAAGKIKNGDVVFLDTSTTVLLMLRYIPDISFTVVTNSLPVIEECYANRKINLYIAPGLYKERFAGTLESSTAEYISQFSFSSAFFGASAVDPKFGASAIEEIESAVKKCAWKNSDESYLLADHSKFSKRNLIRYNLLSDYTAVLSDADLDADARKQIIREGADLEICY